MVGGVTGGAGGGFKITVGANTIGGVVSAGIKGYDNLLSGGTSAVTSSLCWGLGKFVTNQTNSIFNPISNKYIQDTYKIPFKGTFIEVTKFRAFSTMPAYLGNITESIFSEETQSKYHSILKGSQSASE